MKKTLDEVANYFAEHGCELLEKEYVNYHKKMKYRCSCGKISYINFNNFRSGRRCGCGRTGLNRLTKQEIQNEIESFGFIFISSDFIDSKHIVKFICKCGLERNQQLKNTRLSDGCINCRNKKFAFKYQEVANYFAKNGCLLLAKEYKNARSKLKYLCVCGSESEIVFDSFKRGNRCKKCGNKKISDYMKTSRLRENNPNWIQDRAKKRENDLFADRCRMMLRSVLKSLGIRKKKRTEAVLGYKISDFKEHIQSFSNWNSLKNQKWHIDHVFPIKAFLDFGIKDLKLINCLDNLQPLTYSDNCVKNDKYDPVAFLDWLKTKGFKVEP